MSDVKFTPNHLRFAIEFAVSGEPFAIEGYDSEHGKEVREWLAAEGLIDWNRKDNVATPRLRAWVDHLCSQPLPECTWVVPQPPEQP